MKRIRTAGVLALALTVGGCSAQQGHQNQSQAANVAPIEPEAAPQSEGTPKPITGAELLAQQRISGLPVVDADAAVLGVISETDLMARQIGVALGWRVTSDVRP